MGGDEPSVAPGNVSRGVQAQKKAPEGWRVTRGGGATAHKIDPQFHESRWRCKQVVVLVWEKKRGGGTLERKIGGGELETKEIGPQQTTLLSKK